MLATPASGTPLPTSWVAAVTDDVNGPAWTSGGVTAGSGWTVNSSRWRIGSNRLDLQVTATPTSAVTIPSDGNVVDVTIGTLSGVSIPSAITGIFTALRSLGYFILNTDGTIVLSWAAPASDLRAAQAVTFKLSGEPLV